MTNMIQSQQKRFPLLIVFLASLMYHTNGDMSHVVNVCCEIGTAWSRSNSRCDDYVEAVSDISDDEQVTCQMVIGVCCLKSKQLEMCQVGKNFAILEGQCVVRDNTFAAVTYKECCQCCQMGKITRLMGMSCTTPSIGNPCDLMFMECCIGISAEPNLRNMITDSNCPAGFAYNTVSLKCEGKVICIHLHQGNIICKLLHQGNVICILLHHGNVICIHPHQGNIVSILLHQGNCIFKLLISNILSTHNVKETQAKECGLL